MPDQPSKRAILKQMFAASGAEVTLGTVAFFLGLVCLGAAFALAKSDPRFALISLAYGIAGISMGLAVDYTAYCKARRGLTLQL